ncbi:MAG TPA: HupE/UreJ family protein, partial [Thermoanaerobaculia bacterium]|nr:HupE/UreJ family protein [Thermoanaerobaculia bacterium]
VPPPRIQVMLRYLGLGFRHVVPRGSEQILFALGIFLLSLSVKPLLAQVTAFTAASTLACAAAVYGRVALPPRVAAPAIALSIVYLAVENLRRRELRASRIALVFACGLLYGLAFAGALRELGAPRAVLSTAVLGFDLGALAGQLAVLGAVFLLVGLPWGDRPWYRDRVVIPASLAMATLGLYWSVERIFLP